MAFQIPETLKHLAKYIACRDHKYGRWLVKTYTVMPLKGRRGPDDETYQAFPELVALVPRAFSDLFYDGAYVLTLKGMNKFDGTSDIDNDDLDELLDSQPEEASESQSSVGDSKTIFDSAKVSAWDAAGTLETKFVEKANGKFAIFHLFKHEGKMHIFGGSKNMHIVYPLDHLNLNHNLHDDILGAIQLDLKKLSDRELTALENVTVVGEYVDGKHLVYVEKPYLVYFNAPAGVSLPKPKEILPSCRGMPSTDALRAIRAMTNIEGVVLEFWNTTTGEFIRQKHKTEWYIIWRCFREVISKKAKGAITPGELLGKLKQRLNARSDQFLHLSKDSIQNWYAAATDFVTWLTKSTFDYKDCGPFSQVGMAKLLYLFAGGSQTLEPHKLEQKFDELVLNEDVIPKLHNPTLYASVIAAAKFGLPVVVAMSGPSGSGKSTMAHMLLKDLDEIKISAEIFSTDDYFMVNKVYVFDGKKLKENHAKNLEAFKASKAQVRIVDNTNLQRWEYAEYFSSADKAVCIVLSMAVDNTAEIANALAARTRHSVPLKSIQEMLKKYKPSAPAYYGLFPKDDDLQDLLRTHNLAQTQKTPPHVTCVFVGGAYAKDLPPKPELLNTVVRTNIIGYSISDAGCGLVAAESSGSLPGNHITLSTNVGFKPVDVGQQITDANTTLLDEPLAIQTVYLPMF